MEKKILRRNDEEEKEYKCKKCETVEECNCRLIIRNTNKELSNNNKLKDIVETDNIPNEKEIIIIKGSNYIVSVFKVQNNKCAYKHLLANKLSFVNLTNNNDDDNIIAILETFDQTTKSYSIQDFSLFNHTTPIKIDDNKFEISYPFIPNNETHYKDAKTIYNTDSLKNLRVNIYNPDDPFFYDSCYPFVHNGRDVLIKDRRKDFFQQNSLCPIGCDSFKVDFSTKRVICECETDNLDFSNKKLLNDFNNDIIQNNAIVVRCYNLVFHFLYMKVNVGTWIFFCFIFLALLTPSLFYKRELKKVNFEYENQTEQNDNNNNIDNDDNNNNNDDDNNNNNNNDDDDDSNDDNENDNNDNDEEVSSKCSTKASECLPNPPIRNKVKIKNNSKIKHNNKHNIWLNHLSFSDAILYHKRNFYLLFIDILKNQILSSKFSIEIVSFKLLLLLLNISLCFTFNGLFFSQDYISQTYHHHKNILINTQLPRVFISTIFSFISFLFIHFIFSFKKHHINSLSKIKNKLFLFTTIIIAIMTGLWYYITAFSVVYWGSKNIYFGSSALSLIFLFILIIIFSLLLSFLRITSLTFKSQKLFNFTSYLL